MTITPARLLVAAAVVAASLAGATGSAAADGFGFGFSIGGNYPPPPPPVWNRPYYGPAYGAYVPPPVWRPAPRPMPVCQPGWTTRKVYDAWGNLVKVVKVRRDDCQWGPPRHWHGEGWGQRGW